jgi:CO dehydrogenase/acetyl-CoA synthase beta subunit
LCNDDRFIKESKNVINRLKKKGLAVKDRRFPSLFEPTGILKESDRDAFIGASDTVMELGHPATASICLGMVTEKDGLIRENRVSVLGKDLGDLPPGRHPVAFLVLAEGHDVTESTRRILLRSLFSLSRISGVMTRMTGGKLWLRLNRGAMDSGLTLEAMGVLILMELKKDPDRFRKAEVILVAAEKEAIDSLRDIAERMTEERSNRYREALVEKMECETGLDCDECPESETCKVLKDAVVAAEKMKRQR